MVQNEGGEALALWLLEGPCGGQALVYGSTSGICERQGSADRRPLKVTAARKESCRLNETIIAYWLRMSRISLSGLDAADSGHQALLVPEEVFVHFFQIQCLVNANADIVPNHQGG